MKRRTVLMLVVILLLLGVAVSNPGTNAVADSVRAANPEGVFFNLFANSVNATFNPTILGAGPLPFTTPIIAENACEFASAAWAELAFRALAADADATSECALSAFSACEALLNCDALLARLANAAALLPIADMSCELMR